MLRLYTCFKTDAGSIAVPTVIMSHKINVCCCSTASTFSLHPPFQKLLHSLLSAFRSSGAYPFFVRFFFFFQRLLPPLTPCSWPAWNPHPFPPRIMWNYLTATTLLRHAVTENLKKEKILSTASLYSWKSDKSGCVSVGQTSQTPAPFGSLS